MANKPLFGPAGNSESFTAEGHKHTYEAPEWLAGMRLDAYEYSGGNGITASVDTFKRIGEEGRKYGIAMSFHAPYYISLSGLDAAKRLKSIDYIKQSLEAAEALGADIIVIHAGGAAKIERSEAMSLAKDTLYKALEAIPESNIRLGIETMGKVNQLGTLEEIIEMCSLDKRLYPVVDFGHMNARNHGGMFNSMDDYRRVFDSISSRLGAHYSDTLHCHFSKIEYYASGEKKHLTFADTEYGPDFEPLAEAIVKDSLTPRIICESDGTMAEDARTMKTMWENASGLT